MELIRHLPEHIYSGEAHVTDLQNGIGKQLQSAQSARDDLLLQVRPSIATWGMQRYEREYGIEPDISKPMDQRLARWRAKRRGQGTTTKELIRLMASSFSGGEVEVTEHAARYEIEIKFVDTWGVPPNIDDLALSIREVLPAHLAFSFTYRYMVWNMLDAQNLIFDQLDAKAFDWATFTGGAWIV